MIIRVRCSSSLPSLRVRVTRWTQRPQRRAVCCVLCVHTCRRLHARTFLSPAQPGSHGVLLRTWCPLGCPEPNPASQNEPGLGLPTTPPSGLCEGGPVPASLVSVFTPDNAELVRFFVANRSGHVRARLAHSCLEGSPELKQALFSPAALKFCWIFPPHLKQPGVLASFPR